MDGSGALDMGEAKSFVRENFYSGMSDEVFEMVFKQFDTDSSGTIEKDEMVEFIKQIKTRDQGCILDEASIKIIIDKMWDKYDVDHSGSLDKEETKQFIQENFASSKA